MLTKTHLTAWKTQIDSRIFQSATSCRSFSPLSVSLVKVFAPLCTAALIFTGCATPKTALDYIDGTEVPHVPLMAINPEDPAHEEFNVAINLFQPGVDLFELEEDGSGLFAIDDSGVPKIDHKAIDPKIRRLETHFLPGTLKSVLDRSRQWGQTFVSPGEVQSPDLFVDATILASDGHSIALLVQVRDSSGRTWYNDTIKYLTLESDYLFASWPTKDPYDAIYNHIANRLATYRNNLTPEEQKQIRMVSQMRFASDLAPDAFGDYLARNEEQQLYVQRFPAENDPTFQTVQQLHGTELDMLTHIEEYYDNLQEGSFDSYNTWREQFRQLSIEMEQYRVNAQNQKTTSLIIAGLAVATAAATASSDSQYNSNRGSDAAAILAGGLELSVAIYEAAKEKIAIANLKAKELAEISEIAGKGLQPKVIELEGRTYQLTGDVDSRFRQIREIIRQRYLIETGQEGTGAVGAN